MSTIDGLEALERLAGGLVVSCQAPEDNPLHGPVYMAAMAAAAVQGGAAGIRANGVNDITAIRARIGPDIPIMGILKRPLDDGSVFITPSVDDALHVIGAGANLVALDGTTRPRPGGETLAGVVSAIHETGAAALADVGTADHAAYSLEAGVDAIGTTLSGYTPDSEWQEDPDFLLLKTLVETCPVPIFAEGRIWTRDEARIALEIGASFVVVGSAITNPLAITERFVAALQPA
jgi:N-acylglucosamine-6-phosphate 2-epimerase